MAPTRPGIPLRHSRPAQPRSTVRPTRSSHGSPAAAAITPPARFNRRLLPRRRSEDDDAASHLAAPERLEALVDLVERKGATDELVELQATVEVELHQAREVEGRPDRAVHRPLERL